MLQNKILQPLITKASLFAVCAVFGATTSAVAQLDEIIVTAQKKSESSQDVPIAINALPGDTLNEFGITGSDGITKLYPNLSLNAYTSINSGFTIRGVGTQNFHLTAQQAVGTYSDDVSLVSPFTSQFGLFDLERVEVLRGPQNTLYGRNTTGGAVNFISKKPDPQDGFNGYARGTFGNHGRLNGEVAVGFPLGENAAVRGAFQTVNRDGVFYDIADQEKTGDEERHSGRLQFAWFPNDSTSVLLNGHVGYNRGDRGPRKALGIWDEATSPTGIAGTPAGNPIRPAPDCSLAFSSSPSRFTTQNNCLTARYANNGVDTVFNPTLNPATGERTTDAWRNVNDLANRIAEVDFEGVFLKVEHDFGSMALTSISSYDRVDVLFQSNITATGQIHFFPLQEGEYKVFSQELRLASAQDQDTRWIGGLYYSNEDDVLSTTIRNSGDGFLVPGQPFVAGGPPFGAVPSLSVDQEVEIFSVYGQLEQDLSDTVTLTGGLRFTSDDKSGLSTARVVAATNTGFAPPATTPAGVIAPAAEFWTLDELETITADTTGVCPPAVGGLPCVLRVPVEQKLEEFGWKIGLDWRFSDNALAYVNYSRGFKSGAFDTRALAAFFGTADNPVGPEFLDAYEVGVKSNLFDNTLELNAAVFYYTWDDLQTFARDENEVPAFLNVPESRLTGAEVEVKWVPGDGWYLQGGIGYNDTKVVNGGGLNGVANGAPLSNSPKWSLTGLARKEFDLDFGLASIQSNMRWADDQVTGYDDSPLRQIDSTLFLDARASVIFGDNDQYEFAVFGENLTEEETCLQVAYEGALSNIVTCLANPGVTFYGAEIEVRF